VRLIVIGILAAMHLSIEMFLTVGFFSHVSLAGLVLFLPAQFWDSRLLARFSHMPQHLESPAELEKRAENDRSPLSHLAGAICLISLICVFAINIGGFPSRPLRWLAVDQWDPLTTACGLGQKWNMFETVPSRDGWYVAWAKLVDGSEVDLLRQGATVDWNRPLNPAGMYPNHRWQKCFREMAYDDELGYQVFRQPVGEFLCRRWNADKTADRRIAEFEFIYCMENTEVAANASVPPILRERLLRLDFRGS
jgi:hypothetical protein